MKKIFLAVAMLAFMAIAAEAQVIIDYQKRTRNSTLTITYNSGYYGYYGFGGLGFGCGWGGGFGYGFGDFSSGSGITYYSPGVGYHSGSLLSYPGPGAFYSGYGMYSYGTMPGLYGGRPYLSPYGMPPVSDYSPAPPAGGLPAADRLNQLASSKEIEVGRARFKSGDYKGAVDQFRAAVVADTANAVAQAHFAVSLAVAGDLKNADKALRAATEHAPFGKVDFADLFANEKERARVTAALAKVTGEGALAAAFALSAVGEPASLKKLAETDLVAKKLLP